MEKVYKYYEIASSYRMRIDTVSQTVAKLRTLCYGAAVIIIVSKRKAVKNT